MKTTTQNTKEELNKGKENLRKKNQTEILEIKNLFSKTKKTVVGHSNRLEQVEGRISELEEKIEIKEKIEEILVKQLKSCERYMQELNDSIKTPYLRIIGIEKVEEV
jgi:phage shock protein A